MEKVYEPSGNILFQETQKYPRWVSLLVISMMLVVILVIIIVGLTVPEERKDSWIGLAVVVPVAVLILFLFQKFELEKIVTSNGFYYKWRSLHKRYRMIDKNVIERIEVKRFPFLSRGFGWFPAYGWYHILSGGEGIQFYLNNGNRFYFSTADRTGFERALQSLISSNPKTKLSEF